MFERLLLIGADFNALDPEGRIRASLRYAASPEVPAVGEWVRLEDLEENSCLARVEAVEGLSVVARPDWSMWIPGEIMRLSREYRSHVFAEFASTTPVTEAAGELLRPR
jgi:hypothetical protein